MDKKYFHKLNPIELQEASRNNHLPEEYLRPEWCLYEGALCLLGCRMLLGSEIRSIQDCYGCDCCNEDM